MKLLQLALVGFVVCGWGSSTCLAALNFTDGFEGPTLDPFWTASASNGSITFPSTEQVHSGSQSVRFNSVAGLNKDVNLIHNFDTGIYGTFSVWIYDTGAGQASSNYIGMQLNGIGDRASLLVFDFGFGEGSTYNYSPNFASSFQSGISRTLGWHNFEIENSPDSVRYSVDGVQVFQENQGLAVTSLQLFMVGPSFRPAWTSYFDDFSVTEAVPNAAVPEPSSVVLFGCCLVGLGISRMFGRRKLVVTL